MAEGVGQGINIADGMAANLYGQGLPDAGARLQAIYVEIVPAVFHMDEHRFQIFERDGNRLFDVIYLYIYSLISEAEADDIPLAVVLQRSDNGVVADEGLGIGGGSFAEGALE